MRLSDGSKASEGRVEVFHNGSWGTVCNHKWDLRDATVVCHSLGYQSAISSSVSFGEGTGPILLDDVDCVGDEAALTDCRHNGLSVHDCDHTKDAGVKCSGQQKHLNDVKMNNSYVLNTVGLRCTSK